MKERKKDKMIESMKEKERKGTMKKYKYNKLVH